MLQLIQGNMAALCFGPIQAIQREIPQARLQVMTEFTPRPICPRQPAFLEYFILGKILQDDIRLILQRRKTRHEENFQRRPVETNESIETYVITLGRSAQLGPVRSRKNRARLLFRCCHATNIR
jgi:hypothetical protein